MRAIVGQRSAEFLIDQVRKTIRRPSRIFPILRNLALRQVVVVYPPVRRAVSKVLSHPQFGPVTRRLSRLVGTRVRRHVVSLDYHQAVSLLDANRPRDAYPLFRRCLARSSDPDHFFTAAVCFMVGLGRYKEAMVTFARANELRQQQARALGLADSPLRFLPGIWHGAFGHLGQIDYLVKLNILEGRGRDDTILYVAPGAPVPNRFLLEQWRPYLKIVDSVDNLPLPEWQLKALEFNFLAPRLPDGATVQLWTLAARTYRRWHAEGRGPLLSLPADVIKRGWAALESVGIASGDWFVTLHVREAASKAHHAKVHNVLNARVNDYLPAIEEITRRGGWVIRIGDPRMVPLAPMPRVIDYTRSTFRADWMDVFLCAQARFFLGASSGPAHVPPVYGVPAVLTNWWPPAQRPWHPTDIFIPKLYRSIRAKRMLTLDESLAEPFGYCNSVDHLRQTKGVTVDDNAPEDIRLAVVEMFERLDGSAEYTSDDVALRARAEQIYLRRNAPGMARLSRDFLRSHPDFLATPTRPGRADGH